MTDTNQTVQKLEVPIAVRIGRRRMSVRDIMHIAPGSIIELPKHADSELELLANNLAIGTGIAVKIGENFGIKLTGVGAAAADPAA